MAFSRGCIFSKIPGRPISRTAFCGRWTAARSTSPAPQFKAIADECFAGLQARVQDRAADPRLCRHRPWRVGSGARQPVLAGRQGAGRRDRLFLDRIGACAAKRSGSRSRRWPMTGAAPPTPPRSKARLREDREHEIKAVLVVHNETSTGVVHDIAAMRRAIDAARHPALFLRRRDLVAWLDRFPHGRMGRRRRRRRLAEGADAADRHGLYRGQRQGARRRGAQAKLPRVYWDWRRLVEGTAQAVWNGTAPVHFFYGLQEALRMLEEEGLDNVFARHHRLAEATRRAVRVWRQNDGPEIFAIDPRGQSDSVTAVLMPEGHDADKMRADLPRKIQRVARRRARAVAGQAVPHRPSRRSERGDDAGRARRGRDGARPRRRAARQAAASTRRWTTSSPRRDPPPGRQDRVRELSPTGNDDCAAHRDAVRPIRLLGGYPTGGAVCSRLPSSCSYCAAAARGALTTPAPSRRGAGRSRRAACRSPRRGG